jgi:maleylacetoacetate isomerase
MTETVLYDYWRSSACYRVRIALHLAGEQFRQVAVNLLASEHRDATHLARHPLGLVPVLEIDGHILTQSLAIVEYLDETRHLGLLPLDSAARARVRAVAHAIAMDIHPVCNLSVVNYATALAGGNAEVKAHWMHKFMGERLAVVEAMLPPGGRFCFGDTPTLADICLVPQVYNARRWGVSLEPLPRIAGIAAAAQSVAAFEHAEPERQPDAVG